MISRLAPAALALALLAGALAGCTPEPADPEPTPAFSSEAEAFAAAEETYRAYVDALNRVDLSDPETFEEVYAWTTGEANSGERKALSQMHADAWEVSGDTVVAAFYEDEFEIDGDGQARVKVLVCSDVRAVQVLDADGQSMVSDARPDMYALEIVLTESVALETRLAIESSNAVEDSRCGSS